MSRISFTGDTISNLFFGKKRADMRRYLFVSDIHSNYPALRAVLHDSKMFKQFDQKFCLGDIVGYGPFPNECVERIRADGFVSILGNHDRAVGIEEPDDFNSNAHFAVEHNRRVLSQGNLEYLRGLRGLPYVDPEGRFTAVHGSFSGVENPKAPSEERFEDIYILHKEDVVAAMWKIKPASRNNLLGIVGHTHFPMHASCEVDNGNQGMRNIRHRLLIGSDYKAGKNALFSVNTAPLPDKWLRRLLFNFGSVGQPRHGEPKACYGIVEFEERDIIVIYRQVEYDVSETQRKMIEDKFPPPLILRLSEGR